MNLVAKEFVSARDDNRGVLVLSQFAGAARELPGALLVNPYAVDASAHALARALRMSDQEQSSRMQAMRSVVAEFSAHRWAADMLADAARLRTPSEDTEVTEVNTRACGQVRASVSPVSPVVDRLGLRPPELGVS